MNKHLHVISFDVPYPPDYGGVIDIFFKIKALHELGILIHLHCFEYKRNRHPETEKYCHSVDYYSRPLGLKYFFSRLPYIVNTRSDKDLVHNLLKDNYPILAEGLHSSWFLTDKRFSGRKVMIRMHNIEHEYYRQLAAVEKNPFRKFYYLMESKKLKDFETILHKAWIIAAISQVDAHYYQAKFPNVFYIPPFHPFNTCNSPAGEGNYAIYHGNLSVAENHHTAMMLIKRVFPKVKSPCVIAGKNPGKQLIKAAESVSNIRIIADPGEEEMKTLVAGAGVNVIPSVSSTGMKLKLLTALFTGRHCLTNHNMVENSGLGELCIIAETEQEMISLIDSLMNINFSTEMIDERCKLLMRNFSNHSGAEKIISSLFD
ncbi:MAG: glycosyltransferase [Bacteroidia bacterium]|nr:glycosyltransferase [Bacteroidia bacterium]